MASQILGGVELTPGQLARPQAINHEYSQELFTPPLHRPHTPDTPSGCDSEPDIPDAERELTQEEFTELRNLLVTDIRGMLSPEQRRRLDRG